MVVVVVMVMMNLIVRTPKTLAHKNRDSRQILLPRSCSGSKIFFNRTPTTRHVCSIGRREKKGMKEDGVYILTIALSS